MIEVHLIHGMHLDWTLGPVGPRERLMIQPGCHRAQLLRWNACAARKYEAMWSVPKALRHHSGHHVCVIRRHPLAATVGRIGLIVALGVAVVVRARRRGRDGPSEGSQPPTTALPPSTLASQDRERSSDGPTQAALSGANSPPSRTAHPTAWIRRAVGSICAVTRRGFNKTCAGLAIVGVGTGTWGLLLLPVTAVPQPESGAYIELDFAPGHQAHHPISIGVRLLQNQPDQSKGLAPVTEAIDLRGEDLRFAGWSLFFVVPAGVHVVGAPASPIQVGRYSGDEAAAAVSGTPGPQRSGAYTLLLDWNDLVSGPLQVRGADLAAAFPPVRVRSPSDSGQDPQSAVTVQRELDVVGDYAFTAGLPPDQITQFVWSWKDATGQVDDNGVTTEMTVEARSPSKDEQIHADEFQSGILIGVAAAAFIAVVQEFLNSVTNRRRIQSVEAPATE